MRWKPDFVAGLTLAAYLLPAGIGDASLAGLPPETGLYACLFSGLVFWIFCSSRQTVVTVTSALSLLVGASVGQLSSGVVFGDRTRHPEYERSPGVLVVRCESALLYFNVEFVRDRLLALLAARPDRIRLVILFLGTVPKIDLAGAQLVADLRRTLEAGGVALRLAEPHGEVRDALRRVGFEQAHGPLETAKTVDMILLEWQAGAGAARDAQQVPVIS